MVTVQWLLPIFLLLAEQAHSTDCIDCFPDPAKIVLLFDVSSAVNATTISQYSSFVPFLTQYWNHWERVHVLSFSEQFIELAKFGDLKNNRDLSAILNKLSTDNKKPNVKNVLDYSANVLFSQLPQFPKMRTILFTSVPSEDDVDKSHASILKLQNAGGITVVSSSPNIANLEGIASENAVFLWKNLRPGRERLYRAAILPTLMDVFEACPDGYQRLKNGKCYCFSDVMSTFGDFTFGCPYPGSNSVLSSVHNEMDNYALLNLVLTIDQWDTAGVWLGLQCLGSTDSEGCQWVDGTNVNFTMFRNDTNLSNGECFGIDPYDNQQPFKWKNYDCSTYFPAFCELQNYTLPTKAPDSSIKCPQQYYISEGVIKSLNYPYNWQFSNCSYLLSSTSKVVNIVFDNIIVKTGFIRITLYDGDVADRNKIIGTIEEDNLNKTARFSSSNRYMLIVFTVFNPATGPAWTAYFNSTSEPLFIDPSVELCPEFYKLDRKTQRCYFLDDAPGFDGGQAECEKWGNGNMISIHNDLQWNAFKYVMIEGNSEVWTFVGLRKTNGTWSWIDGTPYDYQKWAPGHPKDSEGYCATSLVFKGNVTGWYSTPCDMECSTVCYTPATIVH